MAGFACPWHYRAKLNEGGFKEKICHVLWPFLGGAFIVFVAAYSALTSFEMLTNIMGFGGLVLGFIPLALNRKRGGTVKPDAKAITGRV